MTELRHDADRLRERCDDVVSRWEARVRAMIPVANRDHPAALRDSIPGLVERIAETLASGDRSCLALAEQHGRHRAANGAYTIEQVIREHHLLEHVIIGQHFSILYPEDARQRDEAMEHLRMASDRGRYRGEGWRMKKGGELFLADVLITPMYTGGRLTGYSKVVADLTERSRIVQERELSRTRIRAAEADQKVRDDYIARLSHDLRSPLQAAKMGAELLRRRRDDQATVDRLSRRIADNLGRVDEMIQQLLELNRLRAGETPAIHPRRCALDEVVRSTLEDLSTIHGDRFGLETRGPVDGEWDPDAIRRIVENLCGNAVKYGSRSHPITVTLTRTSHEVQIAVHNHGEPIPPEERERLFDPFARASATGGTHGWGIGLAVVKGLANAHGGRVRVDSDAQAGTTFKIDLPVRPPEHVGP